MNGSAVGLYPNGSRPAHLSRDHFPPRNDVAAIDYDHSPSSTISHSSFSLSHHSSRDHNRRDVLLGSQSDDTLVSPTATFQWVRGEMIGQGSYGRVFLALNATSGEIMAVKQVENSSKQEVVEALKFEIATLRDLEHPHVVQYLGYEESQENLSIFLEYVPGGSIGSCLKNHGRFNEEVTKSFSSQILNGLEYLHSRKLIHRDLKAENILVEPIGTCKISDFGISKHAHEGQAQTGMKGTVFWMAPEVVNPRDRGYDNKIDIWSVGCVIQEMWTGLRPWHGEETIPVMMKLFSEKLPPPIPPDVQLSELAQDLRRECFAIDPRDRPSAAELRKHPYFTLPPDWVFNPADIEGVRKRPAWSPSSGPIGEGAPRPPMKDKDYHQSLTARLPHGTMMSTITQAQLSKVGAEPISPPRPTPSAPPPIVWITPPSSPTPDRFPTYQEPTIETSRLSTMRRKSFYVVNPDPDDADSRRRPTYNPPPLPTTQPPLPPPPRLSTSQSHSQLRTQTPNRTRSHSTPKPPPQTSIPPVPQAPPASRRDSSSDSDDDDDLFWNKPPADIPSSAGSSSTTSTRRSRLSTRRISRMQSKRKSFARPGVKDVYQHLDDYFPDHDIDKPIIHSPPGVPETNRAKRKTLRAVANEKLQEDKDPVRMQRRATKLWGSHTEEVVTVPH